MSYHYGIKHCPCSIDYILRKIVLPSPEIKKNYLSLLKPKFYLGKQKFVAHVPTKQFSH